jgi:hypothetical protein
LVRDTDAVGITSLGEQPARTGEVESDGSSLLLAQSAHLWFSAVQATTVPRRRLPALRLGKLKAVKF